jgi:hypothetical protein
MAVPAKREARTSKHGASSSKLRITLMWRLFQQPSEIDWKIWMSVRGVPVLGLLSSRSPIGVPRDWPTSYDPIKHTQASFDVRS